MPLQTYAEDVHAQRLALQRERMLDRAAMARQIRLAHRAIDESWRRLAGTQIIIDRADPKRAQREIDGLADDLMRHTRLLIETRDDGSMLAMLAGPLRPRLVSGGG